MNETNLYDRLDILGLKGFKHALIRQGEDPNYSQLSFNDRMLQLLDAEISDRENRKIKRLMALSAIKDRQASLENIEYAPKRGLERSQILSLSSCDYIQKGQNVLITGATGVGKSFLAQALAKHAIHEGIGAVYYRVARLLEEIKLARLEGTYTKTIQKLSKYPLLILDDFGVTPLKPDELNDLFEVIEERTLGGSTIITAQLPVKEWHAYLGNETIADAMMDRLIYSAHRIEMKGESMRKTLAQK